MTAGVILAAGSSGRLGRPKQLLPLEGRPLIQHVVDTAAAAGLSPIIVVLGHRAADVARALELPPNARTVENPDYAMGQATSLRCGLEALGSDVQAAVVLLADQPGLGVAAVRDAVKLFQRSGGPVVRTYYRDRPGHPVVLGRKVWEAVMAVEGDRGARDLLAEHPEWMVRLQRDEAAPVDVDTLEDYERIK